MAKEKNIKDRRESFHWGQLLIIPVIIYVVIEIYTFCSRPNIRVYEVRKGSIEKTNDYHGIIIRDEDVFSTDRPGYLSFYAREGKKTAVGDAVFAIRDTAPDTSDMGADSDSDELTQREVADIKAVFSQFSREYSPDRFSDVYDLYTSAQDALLGARESAIMADLPEYSDGGSVSTANEAGVVSYHIDGMEDLVAAKVNSDLLGRTTQNSQMPMEGALTDRNVNVYKIVTSENWSVIFEPAQEDMERLSGIDSLIIKFTADELETKAAFSFVTGSDGKQYGKLDLNRYMVDFINQRYVDFDIDEDGGSGLKIPASAAVEKEFLVIPREYAFSINIDSTADFVLACPTVEGIKPERVCMQLFYADDEYFYVSADEDSAIQAGASLIMPQPDETEEDEYVLIPGDGKTYSCREKRTLKGVYNINKGYASFRYIDILDSNSEYLIVRSHTYYSISEYDRIAADGQSVHEGMPIYK